MAVAIRCSVAVAIGCRVALETVSVTLQTVHASMETGTTETGKTSRTPRATGTRQTTGTTEMGKTSRTARAAEMRRATEARETRRTTKARGRTTDPRERRGTECERAV